MSRYLTTRALARECNVCTGTARKWIYKYNIPHVQMGGLLLVKESDFDHLMRRMKNKMEEPVDPIVEKLSRELDEFLGIA